MKAARMRMIAVMGRLRSNKPGLMFQVVVMNAGYDE
jgi:hypothetical protein